MKTFQDIPLCGKFISGGKGNIYGYRYHSGGVILFRLSDFNICPYKVGLYLLPVDLSESDLKKNYEFSCFLQAGDDSGQFLNQVKNIVPSAGFTWENILDSIISDYSELMDWGPVQ